MRGAADKLRTITAPPYLCSQTEVNLRTLKENTPYLTHMKIFFTFSLVNSKKSINFAAANDSDALHSDGA